MANVKESGCLEDTLEQGRSCKLTEKAHKEKLQRCITMRKRKLGALTSKMKDVEAMMSDAQNFRSVQEVMENDFAPSLNEFTCLNNEVASLLPEDETISDQEKWFEPKMASIKKFMKETKRWIADVHGATLQKEKDDEIDLQDTVKTSDSVSQVGTMVIGTPVHMDLKLAAHQPYHEFRQHVLNKKLNTQLCLNVRLHRRKDKSLKLKWPDSRLQRKNLSWRLH